VSIGTRKEAVTVTATTPYRHIGSDLVEVVRFGGTVLLDEVEIADTFECPRCERDVVIIDTDSVPSMLGYGSDDSLQLACGHSITFDPFTGRPSAH
jgi:hypothetical protein